MTSRRTGAGRRSFSFDPRLLIGLALVAASVAGVVALVSTADETIEVLAAGEALTPGDRVVADDLVVVDVRLDAASARYLVPGKVPDDGLIVARTIGKGELVPIDAVGAADSEQLAALVLEVRGALAASVQPGSTVDVWAAREVEGGAFGPPSVVAGSATVVRLVNSDSIVSGSATTAVEVLVAKPRIARVLEAAANSDAISIVPTTVPVR